MNAETEIPSLANLEYIPYVDENGDLPNNLQGKIGVYAIFDRDKALQLINYSRDIYLSLKQHLVRQHENCYWVKAQTSDRPNRTILENIRDAWIEENGAIPPGNGTDAAKWIDPIDAKLQMTPEEQAKITSPMIDEVVQAKLIKNVARRVEEEILAQLKARGVQAEIRFNPKLKESGLLDLK